MLQDWILRSRSLFRRQVVEQELDDELRFHLEQQTAALIRGGLPHAEAVRRARLDLGGLDQIKEEHRDSRGVQLINDLTGDVRYALRQLRRSPGFATAAIVCLALGIGATTAIYSVVDTILLQPLPYADSDRLMRVVENVPLVIAGRPPLPNGLNYRGIVAWQAHTTAFDETAAMTSATAIVKADDGTARLPGSLVSDNLFAMLGIRAMLGRTIVPGDDASPNVMVVTFDAWRRIFHGDSSRIGTAVDLQIPDQPDGRLSMTLVGVLPPGVRLPLAERSEFFIPRLVGGVVRGYSSELIGRLRPGASVGQAAEEAASIGRTIPPRGSANSNPLTGPRFEIRSVKDETVNTLRPALRVLLGAVVVVLLIVCANVANLLLARATARRQEMAVRFAIGASRGRVIRQVLTECLVLALAGGAFGALVAAGGVTLVQQLASVEAPGIFRQVFGASILPRAAEIGVDLKMLAAGFGLATITSIVVGIWPAAQMSRSGRLHAIGARDGHAGRHESRVRAALVVCQVTLATVLLVGAGLLVHSFIKLSHVDSGFDPAHVLAFQVVFPPEYPLPRKTETIDAVLTRLRANPDVESAGFTRAGMLIPEEIVVGTFVPPGRTVEEMRADPAQPGVRPVSQGFLRAMGVRLIEGRDFDGSDLPSAAPVLVISQSVARRYFGQGSAVGQPVDWHYDASTVRMQVIGVVDDVRNESPAREPVPAVFVEYRQLLEQIGKWGRSTPQRTQIALGLLSFAVRMRGDPAAAIPVVSQSVRAVDPDVGIDAMIPMERLAASVVARPRFYMVMLGVFASVAAVLAAIGIYGVLTYLVIQRTREIGMRMALGARRQQVLTLILGRGALLTVLGLALGLAGAAAGARVLRGMLFGVSALDPQTFAAVSVLFALAALVASYLPALRASKVDPMVALRSD